MFFILGIMKPMNASERENSIRALLNRRTEAHYPSREDVERRLVGSEKLTVYFGIDPTGAEIHLGHTIPLLLLKNIASLGHDAVVVVGDFTAQIGDPTGKASARTTLSTEDIERNMATYLDQVTKVVPKELIRFAYNSEWLSHMSLEQVLKLGKLTTVQQLLQRDMFQERLKAEKPIYLNEFLYPMMQGYDSVALRADGEIGGSDQTFNMLMGRELSKEILGKDKIVLTTKLLVDTATGKKMSKSEGNLIAITDSPQEMRRKILDIDDSMTQVIFELCTERDLSSIPEDPRAAKEDLAAELVRMYHGDEAVAQASEAIEVEGKGTPLQTMYASGVVSSLSIGKNLFKEGAVKINGEVAERWDVAEKTGDVIEIGKGKKIKIK